MNESNLFQRVANRISDQMTTAIINSLLSVLVFLIRPLATVTEVLFHKNMGERYFTLINVLVGISLIALTGIPATAPGLDPRVTIGLAIMEGLAFIFASFQNFRAVIACYRDGVRWHSYNHGISRFRSIDPRWEHAILLVAAILLAMYGVYGLAVLVISSTYFSLMMRFYEARKFRERVLNTIDSQIEQENLAQAVMQRLRPEQVEGLMTPMPAYASDKYRERFIRAVQPGESSASPSSQPWPPLPPVIQTGRRTPIGVWAGLTVVVLLLLTPFAYDYMNRAPGKAVLRQAVESRLKTPVLRVVDMNAELASTPSIYGSALSKTIYVQERFNATVELTETTYTSSSVTKYLEQQGMDSSIFQRIDVILHGEGGSSIKSMAKLTGPVASLSDVVLLQKAFPAGHRFPVSGQIHAVRQKQVWTAEVVNLSSDRQIMEGRPRRDYSPHALIVDEPQDAEKLKTMVKGAADVLQSLEHSRAQYLKQRDEQAEKDRQTRMAAEAQWMKTRLATIQEGSLFEGSATQGNANPQRLYLEITKIDQEKCTVSALLRNDGGWNEDRPFQGTYRMDASRNEFTLQLETTRQQAVRHGGPFLQSEDSLALSFAVNKDSLSATNDYWTYAFKRVPDDQRKNVENNARAEEMKWLDATKPDTVYLGQAVLPNQPWSEKYLLKFTEQQQDDGIVIEAELQSLANPDWKRKWRGSLLTHRYQADGHPLRLISGQNDGIRQAGDISPLGWPGELRWYPQLDEDRLVCNDTDARQWQLKFKRATPEELKTVAVASPLPKVINIQPGTVLEGVTLSGDKSHSSAVRIRIDQIDPNGTNLKGSMESLTATDVRRNVYGSFDSAMLILKTKRNQGTIDMSGTTGFVGGLLKVEVRDTTPQILFENWFRDKGEYTFQLMATDGRLSGKEVNTGWDIWVRPGIEIKSEVPEEEGAYLYSQDKWVALPTAAIGQSAHRRNQQEVLNDMQKNPQGPWLVEYNPVTCDKPLPVDAGGTTLLAVRGGLQTLSHIHVTQTKTPVIRLTVDPDSHWWLPAYISDNSGKVGPARQEVFSILEKKGSDLHLIRFMDPLPAGPYMVYSSLGKFLLEIKK